MEYIIGIVVVIAIIYFISSSTKKVEKPITNQKKEIPKSQFVLTNEFREILEILKNTNESLFITGKAGTGKSSLLKHFIKNTNKN